MKKGKRIFLVLAAVVLLALGKNAVAKAAVFSGVRAVTGLRLQIQSMSVGIFRPAVEVKGVKIFNPSGFTDRIMVDLPELFIRYDPGALLRGKVHLKSVRMSLKEFLASH